MLGPACLAFACLSPSCPSFPRSSQHWGKRGCTPLHSAPRAHLLPHSQAKSTLHASNPIICYLRGQGPGWKPCLPARPSSGQDHGAMRSLLRRAAQRGQGPPWASAQHSSLRDGALRALMGQGAPTSGDNCHISWGLESHCCQGSWGCLPTTPTTPLSAPTHCTPPVPPRASHPDDFSLLLQNKLLTPAILWADCSSCELMGRASTGQPQLPSPLKSLLGVPWPSPR